MPDDDRRFGWAYADLYQADVAGQVYKTSTVKDRAHHPKTSLVKMLVEDMHVLPSPRSLTGALSRLLAASIAVSWL